MGSSSLVNAALIAGIAIPIIALAGQFEVLKSSTAHQICDHDEFAAADAPAPGCAVLIYIESAGESRALSKASMAEDAGQTMAKTTSRLVH
jgi:hypothetical protein